MVRAINLAQTKYDKDSTDWRNTFNLARYYLVANHFDIVAGIYQNGLIEASADRIEAAQRDRQEFLSLFPDHAPT